jgi:hypothetical protein
MAPFQQWLRSLPPLHGGAAFLLLSPVALAERPLPVRLSVYSGPIGGAMRRRLRSSVPLESNLAFRAALTRQGLFSTISGIHSNLSCY